VKILAIIKTNQQLKLMPYDAASLDRLLAQRIEYPSVHPVRAKSVGVSKLEVFENPCHDVVKSD